MRTLFLQRHWFCFCWHCWAFPSFSASSMVFPRPLLKRCNRQNSTASTISGKFWEIQHSGTPHGFPLKFGLTTALTECLLGLFLAVYLAPLIRRHGWMVAVLIAPMIIAPAMMGLMYRLVLHEFVGPLPHYLYALFGQSPSFLNAQNVFLTVYVIETLQWTPFAFLLFLAAYQSIPTDFREAASVDGTRPWRMFLKIELPLMLPTLGIALFVRFIDGFRVFDNVFVLVGSGPGGATTSMSIYIYEAFFRVGDIGRALAASILLFIAAFAMLSLVSLINKRMT